MRQKHLLTLLCTSLLCLTIQTGCGRTADPVSSDSVSTDSISVNTESSNQTKEDGKDTSTMSKNTVILTKPIDKTKPIIALTFDDGPNTGTTLDVLEVLEKYQVPASFFVIGNNINDKTSDVVKKAFDMGCEIQNHSLTHSDMTTQDPATILDEINTTSDKIFAITGTTPTFFRPPFIAVNQQLLDTVDLNFISGYGANDWEDSVSAEERAEKIITQAKDGAIILLHDMDGNQKTVDALDTIIPTLLDQGYQFVTISQLFETKNITLTTDTDIIYSYAEQTTMY